MVYNSCFKLYNKNFEYGAWGTINSGQGRTWLNENLALNNAKRTKENCTQSDWLDF
jgi:hypothetical protein